MENKTNKKQLFIGIVVAAVALVAGLGGFASGVSYQKSHSKSSAKLTASNGSGPIDFQGSGGPSFSNGGGGPMTGSGSLGTVTAISAGSITVKNSRSGESSTYAIVSSTQITKDNTLASYTDITTDSTVMVTPDSAHAENALSITVDPEFGRMGANSQSSDIQTN